MAKLRNLKAEMVLCGMHSKDLADAIGVKPSTISTWLSCRSAPSLAMAFAVARVLDQPVDYLFVQFEEE